MANEKFRVKFGLQVGDTTADINASTGDITTIGDINVNGGDIKTTASSATVFNDATATTVSMGGSATTVSIGANTGTTTINNSLVADELTVSGDLAVNGGDITTSATSATVFNATATTLSLGGAATTVSIGADTGTTTVNNALAADSITVSGDAAINGGDITTSATSVTVFDATATTVNAFSAATILNLGNASAGQTIGIGTASTANSGYNIGSGVTASGQTKTINLGTGGASGSITDVNIGSATSGATGTTTVNSGVALTLAPGATTTTTNIGPTTVGSSIIAGANRLTSPVIFNFAGSNNYRGLLLNNATSGSYATARNGIVMRTVPTTSIGPRGGIVFENARSNSSGVLAALQGPSTTQVGDFLREITSGGYATDRYVTEAVATTAMAFTPYAAETWVNSGTTVSAAGTGWALQLQPTATNLSATSKITTIDSTPQGLQLRSDTHGFSKGKTIQFVATGCSTSGTTLTIGTVTSGTVTVGSMIQNSTNLLPAGTYIIANISGSGSGSTWTLNQTQTTYTSSLTLQAQQGYTAYTGTGDVDVIGDLTVRGNDIKSSSGTTQIVTSAAGATLALAGDTITLESSAGTDYAVLSANTAKFNVPVTTELTTTTISEGTTYTPAATVDNNISVQINTLSGGTTVIDLTSLTGNSRGGSYNILVFNNTASGTPLNVINSRISGSNLMSHTITTGNPRIIINAYVVGDYATATHLVVA